jgi:tubulin-folding cofactor B
MHVTPSHSQDGSVKGVRDFEASPTTNIQIQLVTDNYTMIHTQDGSVKGVRYFEAEALHGSFVRPSKVTVGDYPVEDTLEEL